MAKSHAMDAMTDRLIARIRERRYELGLTQDDLARRSGIPTTAIASMESRRRGLRVNEAVALAAALDLDLVELLDPEAAA